MQAAYIEQTGPPEAIKVGDLPKPSPGPKQVLVRVRAAALNPIDLYIRSGLVAMPMSFPQVIGADFAGTVETNNTTKATAGTILTVHADAFNVQVGWDFLPTPELRPVLGPSGRLTVEVGRLGPAIHADGHHGERVFAVPRRPEAELADVGRTGLLAQPVA